MTYSEALRGYIQAYNDKQAILNDPMSDPGVLAEEAANLQGEIEMARVQSYDDAVIKIDEEIPRSIAEQQAKMDAYAPIIKDFFRLVAPKLNLVYSDDRSQTIRLVEDEIVVSANT